jgi:hypothetical protein
LKFDSINPDLVLEEITVQKPLEIEEATDAIEFDNGP